MIYHSDHKTNLKPLNLQFRQKTKNFYTKRLVRNWTMVSSWNLNYLTGYIWYGVNSHCVNSYCVGFSLLCLTNIIYSQVLTSNRDTMSVISKYCPKILGLVFHVKHWRNMPIKVPLWFKRVKTSTYRISSLGLI